MAALTVQTIVQTGLTPTFAAATATTGDTFPIDARTYFHVKNGGGSSINVTFTSYAAARAGLAVTDQVVAVAAGAEKLVTLDPTAFGDPSSGGVAKAVCSAVTSVTIAAFRH